MGEADVLGDPSVLVTPLELPVPPHLLLDASHLDQWLRVHEERAEGARLESGLVGLGLGAVETGLGLWLMLDDATFGPLRERGLIGAATIGIGVSALAIALYELFTTSFASLRRQRWRLALEGGLDERELGRFEGELRAEAEVGRFLRMVGIATGIANAGAGIAALLTTALAPLSDDDRIGGYVIGGTLALAGLVGSLTSLLIDSDAEVDWRLYSSGHGPDDEAAADIDVSVAPSVGSGSLGIELRGTF